MPVEFVCQECGLTWESPPHTGCLSGCTSASIPPPEVWDIGRVPGTDIFISAHLRDHDRMLYVKSLGISSLVDIAGDPDQVYVWRPSPNIIRGHGFTYSRVDDVIDNNVDLPFYAFSAVFDAVMRAQNMLQYTLVFCAAGLKRSPHLIYGVLLRMGWPQPDAWDAVKEARPIADKWPPYIEAAEKWVSSVAPHLSLRPDFAYE